MARKWTRTASNCKEDGFGPQQGFSTIAAVTAWGLPAAHTIAVLVTRDVDADELTGRLSRQILRLRRDGKRVLSNRGSATFFLFFFFLYLFYVASTFPMPFDLAHEY